MFIKNTWYVACRAEEVQLKSLGRTICAEKIVFYRGKNNEVAAVADFCPHRGAPLSLGHINKDGHLVCGYHGLTIGSDGKVLAMPSQRVQDFPCNKSFATLEKYGFIWVWPGDQSCVRPEELPTLAWAESQTWTYDGGLFHVHCDYQLMIDNLMDLSHETYVHAGSIGQKEIDTTLPTTKTQGDHVTTERHMNNVTAPPFWKMALRGNQLEDDVAVDRWQICRFSPPSHVHIDVGVAHAGHGGYHAADNKKVASIVVDFITPETETSHWYFWGMARNFQIDNQTLTAQIRDGQQQIFSEDLAILEQQQQNILQHPERQLLMLNIDAGGVQSRKVIQRLLAQEQANSAHRAEHNGRNGFSNDRIQVAQQNTWHSAQIHQEHFVAIAQDILVNDEFIVEIKSTGQRIVVAVNQTVVEALEENGYYIATSCGQGICGTCLTHVLEGEPDHRDLFLSDEEHAMNHLFTPCCSRSNSKVLVLDL